MSGAEEPAGLRVQIARALRELDVVRELVGVAVGSARDNEVDLALMEAQLFIKQAMSSLTKAAQIYRHG
jgi:hypothetical protein